MFGHTIGLAGLWTILRRDLKVDEGDAPLGVQFQDNATPRKDWVCSLDSMGICFAAVARQLPTA